MRGDSGEKGDRGTDGLPGRDSVAVEGEAVPGPRGPAVSETRIAESARGVISD